MQVTFSPYSQYSRAAQTAFKSNENVYEDSNGKVINKTVTYMFRNDLDWEDFGRYLNCKYKNTEDLNITDYACSDGSEAYTLAMTLFEFAPKIVDKAFPIIAKDKYQYAIDNAQSGICNIYDSDIYAINYFTKNKFNDYFQAVCRTQPDAHMAITPKPPLQDKIIFEQADILKDLDNLPEENNIILCRNCWKYFDKENYHNLAEQLYEKTKDNGVVVIGQVENDLGIPLILNQHGFRETYVDNVYEPVKRMTA